MLYLVRETEDDGHHDPNFKAMAEWDREGRTGLGGRGKRSSAVPYNRLVKCLVRLDVR